MPNSPSQLDALVEGLPTKSEKIRTLARHGVSTADIARYLGIRYQHARNVLLAEGLHRPVEQASGQGFAEPHQPTLLATTELPRPQWLTIGSDGSVKLPKEFLLAASLQAGGRVRLNLEGDSLELLSQDAALQRIKVLAQKYVPEGVSLSDELIADRRREVAAEEQKWKRLEAEAEAAKNG